MMNNPNTYSSHGSAAHELHMFSITDAQVPTVCNSCHGNGNSNVDGASLQASVVTGLATIVNNMSAAMTARINDCGRDLQGPDGLRCVDGHRDDHPRSQGCDRHDGELHARQRSQLRSDELGCRDCLLASNALVSAVVSPQGRSGINVILTFTNPISLSFKGASGTVVNSLSPRSR